MSWAEVQPLGMRLAAHLLQDLGFVLYAGPLVAFTVLVIASAHLNGLPVAAAVRSYRAWGPGLGLALGACILGTLSGHWLDNGEWLAPTDAITWVTCGLFGLSWVSNIKLEIWTLEPLRQLDSEAPSSPPDPAAYAGAARHLGGHMALHSALLLAVSVLEISRRWT
jgi:hypothetical protein